MNPTTEQWTSSLDLLARVSSALRTCVVDDMHLANRIGLSIEVLVRILTDSTCNFVGGNTKNGYLSLFIERSRKRKSTALGNNALPKQLGLNTDNARGSHFQQQSVEGAVYQNTVESLDYQERPETIQGEEHFYHDNWLWPIGQDAYDILSYSMPELERWERED